MDCAGLSGGGAGVALTCGHPSVVGVCVDVGLVNPKGDAPGSAAEADGVRPGDSDFVNGEENIPGVGAGVFGVKRGDWTPAVAGTVVGIAGKGKTDPRGCCPNKPPRETGAEDNPSVRAAGPKSVPFPVLGLPPTGNGKLVV